MFSHVKCQYATLVSPLKVLFLSNFYAGGLLGAAVLYLAQSWLSVVGTAMHMHAASPAAGSPAYDTKMCLFRVHLFEHLLFCFCGLKVLIG